MISIDRTKKELRERLKRDVDEFVAKGGKITHIPYQGDGFMSFDELDGECKFVMNERPWKPVNIVYSGPFYGIDP